MSLYRPRVMDVMAAVVLLALSLIVAAAPVAMAFAPSVRLSASSTARSFSRPPTTVRRTATLLPSSDETMHAFHGMVQNANHLLIATIDSDVANIPENEFATVFAGGIIVMFGGLFSALAVGFILEKRNLYANIVAESYAQGGDEEFWKGLSEEEKKKTQSLLQQLRESKEGEGEAASSSSSGTSAVVPTVVAAATEASNAATPPPTSTTLPNKETKQIGMFSDYGDD